MTYFLYRTPANMPSVTDHEIPALPPDWTLVAKSETPFNVDAHKFGEDGKLTVDMGELRRRKKLETDRALLDKTSGFIEHAGTKLDADAAAVAAIRAKLEELSIRPDTPVEQLYWRDWDNVHRHFTTVAEYQQFLAGALAAIMARNSEAQAWAFATKSKIEATANPMALMSLALLPTVRAISPAAMAATPGGAGRLPEVLPVHPDALPPPTDSVASPPQQG